MEYHHSSPKKERHRNTVSISSLILKVFCENTLIPRTFFVEFAIDIPPTHQSPHKSIASNGLSPHTSKVNGPGPFLIPVKPIVYVASSKHFGLIAP